MSIYFNHKIITPKFNGVDIKKVYFNGTLVYSSNPEIEYRVNNGPWTRAGVTSIATDITGNPLSGQFCFSIHTLDAQLILSGTDHSIYTSGVGSSIEFRKVNVGFDVYGQWSYQSGMGGTWEYLSSNDDGDKFTINSYGLAQSEKYGFTSDASSGDFEDIYYGVGFP